MILAAISRIKSKSVSRDRKCQGGNGLLGCDALIRCYHRRTVSFMSSVAFRAGKKQDDHIQFTMLRGRRERVSSCDSVLEGRKHPQTQSSPSYLTAGSSHWRRGLYFSCTSWPILVTYSGIIYLRDT